MLAYSAAAAAAVTATAHSAAPGIAHVGLGLGLRFVPRCRHAHTLARAASRQQQSAPVVGVRSREARAYPAAAAAAAAVAAQKSSSPTLRLQQLSTSTTSASQSQQPSASSSSPPPQRDSHSGGDVLATYTGPLHKTFRRLKLFSLSSLVFASALTPYLLLGPGALDTFGRVALVITALSASGASTALISWIGKPYVGTLQLVRRRPETAAAAAAAAGTNDPLPPSDTHLIAHTTSWRLQPLETTIFQPSYIRGTSRPFAAWQLAANPPPAPVADPAALGAQTTSPLRSLIAETRAAKTGSVVGQYWVEWRPDALSRVPMPAGEDAATDGETAASLGAEWRMEGVCKVEGNPVRHFNVHEELLDDDWRVLE